MNAFIDNKKVSNSSLISFRIFFGLLLLLSTIRFIFKGWIHDFYVVPQYHFTYYGFHWIKPLSENGMNYLFYFMLLFSVLITTGLFYRLSIICFFIIFTYIELIDKTYYLNHYYAVSLICFMMIFLPLNKRFSIDLILSEKLGLKNFREKSVDKTILNCLKLQVGLLYFFAGLAKINYDWMVLAQPLKIWLHAETDLPIIGGLLQQRLTPYIMSWIGAAYDLSITFLLLNNKTRKLGFISVLIFHIFTWILFNIGVFPWVMIILATLFFAPDWFEFVLKKFEKQHQLDSLSNNSEKLFPINFDNTSKQSYLNFRLPVIFPLYTKKVFLVMVSIYFLIQIILPLRHYFYSGDFFWTEQGFRFSWNVMIIEKTGFIEFNIKDRDSGKKFIVSPKKYLTPLQSKMMSTQPDMILQFAHYLNEIYKKKGYKNLEIKADSYVALNGRQGKKYIKPDVNLLDYNENSDVNNFVLPI